MESRPQKIKIEALKETSNNTKPLFCPFTLTRQYIKVRGNYKNENDQFFTFHDNQPVAPKNACYVLNECLKNLGLNGKLYSFHSLRSGMATELIKNSNNIELVKTAGHWKSNAVYKYLKL